MARDPETKAFIGTEFGKIISGVKEFRTELLAQFNILSKGSDVSKLQTEEGLASFAKAFLEERIRAGADVSATLSGSSGGSFFSNPDEFSSKVSSREFFKANEKQIGKAGTAGAESLKSFLAELLPSVGARASSIQRRKAAPGRSGAILTSRQSILG